MSWYLGPYTEVMTESRDGSHLEHHAALWRDFPQLSAVAMAVTGVHPGLDLAATLPGYLERARTALAGGPESELPAIRAWRRSYATMGLKPTQYRCAAEALLRRLRKEGELPRLHPLVDLCNAMSLAYAVPVAAFDLDEVAGALQVRYADGDESYLTFAGEVEHPAPGEVVFADRARQAHSRRWATRQSGRSAVRAGTGRVLVVAEAMHEGGQADCAELGDQLAGQLRAAGLTVAGPTLLSADRPRFGW